MYLNVVALVKLLRLYPHYDDWYIGKPSVNRPIISTIKDDSKVRTLLLTYFITGLAFCIFVMAKSVLAGTEENQ